MNFLDALEGMDIGLVAFALIAFYYKSIENKIEHKLDELEKEE